MSKIEKFFASVLPPGVDIINKIEKVSNPTSSPSSSVEPLISALSTAAASQLETLDLLGDGLEVVTLIRSFKSIRINIFSDLPCSVGC